MSSDMEKMRSYSGLFIIDPDKEDVAEEVHNDIKKIISENNGNVLEEKQIGKKKLAYPIQKKSEAIYYELAFSAVPSAIEKINRLCRINTSILRTIVNSAD